MNTTLQRKLAADLREHSKAVQGIVVKQDLLSAAHHLEQSADLIDRLREIDKDAGHQMRQLNTTLAELGAELAP